MRLWHICLCIYGCLNVISRINLLFCTQSDFYRYSSFVVVSCATFFPLHPIIPNSGKETPEKNFVGEKTPRKKSEEIKSKERNLNSWDRNSNRPTLSKGQRKEIRWWVLLWRRFVVRRSDKIKRWSEKKERIVQNRNKTRKKNLSLFMQMTFERLENCDTRRRRGKIYPFSRLGEWEKSSTSRRTKSDFVLIFTPILTNLQLYSLFLVCSRTK